MATNLFSEIRIPSTYHGLPVTMYIRKGSSASDTVLVLHPGAFESAWGDNGRYKKILLWLQNHLSTQPTILTYETSRQKAMLSKLTPDDPRYWQKKETYWRKAFAGKIFNQELDDVRRVYVYIQQHLHAKHVWALGLSVGGTIAMILSSEVPAMNKLCVVGSAISTKRPYLPVLTGYPAKAWILKRIASYTQDIKILQGRRDTVVPLGDAEEVFHALQNPHHASFERFAEADHMFSGNNRYGLFKYDTILLQMKDFFEN